MMTTREHPTEPGWYWLWGRMGSLGWEVVEVQHDGKHLYISATESEDYEDFDHIDYKDVIWGEKIPYPAPPEGWS